MNDEAALRRLLQLAGPDLLTLANSGIVRLSAPRTQMLGTFAWTEWHPVDKVFEICIDADTIPRLSDAQVRLALRHELGHIIGGHFRFEPCGTDMLIATDISVNFWLLDKNKELVEMSQTAVGPDAMPVLADEWLERLGLPVTPHPVSLLHEKLHEMAEGEGQSGCGGIGHVSAEDAALAEALAEAAAQTIGTGSSSQRIPIQSHTPPQWVTDVINFMAAFKEPKQKHRRTMSRPQQALLQAARYVASKKWRWDYGLNRICLLVDTSGSMVGSLHQLNAAIATLAKAGIVTRLIAGDTRVLLDEDVTHIDELPGAGGTDIVPLFKRAAELRPKAVVCFTDGYVPAWPSPDVVGVPTLWVLPKGMAAPYGKRTEYA